MYYWIWKDKDGKLDIETLRDDKGACENFVTIRYYIGDYETRKNFFKRLGGKVQRVKIEEA